MKTEVSQDALCNLEPISSSVHLDHHEVKNKSCSQEEISTDTAPMTIVVPRSDSANKSITFVFRAILGGKTREPLRTS